MDLGPRGQTEKRLSSVSARGLSALSITFAYDSTVHQPRFVHDIEPRDGPADTELSGPAIASSHGRVKARGAARGGERATSSREHKRERGGRESRGSERESATPESREKKENLTRGPLTRARKDEEDGANGLVEAAARTPVLYYVQRTTRRTD